jgi:MoaA/NifB/PqqE/SkfB family radical SAM enzyme
MFSVKKIAFQLLKYKHELKYRKAIVKQYPAHADVPLDILMKYNSNRQTGYQPHICNAPYTSIYFGIDGSALACCKNRSYTLGHISRNTIQEIWNGARLKQLRESLNRYDFSSGCSGCLDGICAGKYANVMAASYDDFHTDKTPEYPLRMDFELSSTCNLACIMCDGNLSSTYRKHFQHLPPKPEHYGADFLNQLSTFIPHLKKANFLGGEPFLIGIYYEIWELLLSQNPDCLMHVQTNGHILNNKVKRILEKGRFSIGMSLESLNKEQFQQIRLFSNYDKFLENFRYFKAYCSAKSTYFNLAISPLRSTVRELPDFVHFANEEQVHIYFNTVTEPHDLALWSLPSAELHTIIRALDKVELPQHNSTASSNAAQYHSFINQLKQWATDAEQLEESMALHQHKPIEELKSGIADRLMKHTGKYTAHSVYEVTINDIEDFMSRLRNTASDFRKKLLFLSVIDHERLVYEFLRNR